VVLCKSREQAKELLTQIAVGFYKKLNMFNY